MKGRGFLRWMLGILLVSGITSGLSAQAVSFDNAINKTALDLASVLNKGDTVAVVSFDSSGEQFSAKVVNDLTKALINDGFKVVERNRIDLILAEQDFQMSGNVDDNSAVSVGKLLGAQSIITGTGQNMADYYRVNFKMLSVKTGEIQKISSEDIEYNSTVRRLLSGKAASNAIGNTKFYVGGKLGVGIGLHTISKDLYSAFGLTGANPQEESGATFPISIYAGYRIFDRLAVQTGLDFMFNNNIKAKGTGWSADGKYSTMDIPILLRYSIIFSPVEIDLLGGVYLSFATSKLNLDAGTYYSDSTSAENATFGISIGASVGYKLGPGSIIGNIQFFNDFNPIKGEVNHKMTEINTQRLLNIMIGYEFKI